MEPLPWLMRGLDAVWLRQPRRVRISVRPQVRADVRAAVRQADGALRDATDGEGEHRALRLLLAAVAVATTPTPPEGAAADDVRRGAAHVDTTLTDPLLRKSLADASEREVPTSHDFAHRRRLRDLCAWTVALLDTRSDREMRVHRWLQWAAVAVAALLVARATLGDRNLARGRAVTASSLCPSTPAAPQGKDRLARLVDGERVERSVTGLQWSHGTYAACTTTEVHPWITVDLGAERTIHEVVIYNRADCCWGLDDTPLAIQISSDNRSFETVATRYDPFSDDFPWRRKIGRRRARYVRLYNPAESAKNIVLGEIEIYGR